MRASLILLIVISTGYAFAQSNLEKNCFERRGFFFGVGLGAGALMLNTNNTATVSLSTTLPNIKAGYMMSRRLALLVSLPGASYRYNGIDRGFEGLVISG